MSNGHPLPAEVVLSLHEAKQVLFALDDAIEAAPARSELALRLEAAARVLVEKLLSDLPDL